MYTWHAYASLKFQRLFGSSANGVTNARLRRPFFCDIKKCWHFKWKRIPSGIPLKNEEEISLMALVIRKSII